MLYQSELSIDEDSIKFIVLSEDIQQANVTVYDIPIIDDDDDDTYERFNYRLLNLHQGDGGVDVYVSQSDETFNEATLITNASYHALSDNQKLDQGSYVFYLTEPGQTEVVFQSSAIDYYYSAQYVMVIRQNNGAGTSSYVIDKVSNSSTVEYVDLNAEAEFRAYNAIGQNELLPQYHGQVSLHVNQHDDVSPIESLSYGQLSDAITIENGDYSVDLVTSDQQLPLLSNHLLSLPENANKTIFFYSDEENVDDDGDGNVDENGDGIVDEKELTIHSLVVNSSSRESIYDHEMKLINLVDTDDFSAVTFYFVRADETIDTAFYQRTLGFADSTDLTLKNNTYQVYVVAKYNSSDIILSNFELILDEGSVDQFVVVELDESAPTGYKTSVLSQGGNNDE